jgi:hypothetical protein
MTTYSIRPAAAADITTIYADAVVNGTASFEIEPLTEAEMARRVTRHRSGCIRPRGSRRSARSGTSDSSTGAGSIPS